MLIVFMRDLKAYFRTAIGYTFIGVFLTLSSIIFFVYNLQNLLGDLLSFMAQLTLLVMLLCPLLTMRLLCEERQKKTDQLLYTSPVTLTQIVVGKFMAASGVMFLTLLVSNVFVVVIAMYGTVFVGEWFVGYLGFFLQSMSFIALDLFVSCFAKNQVTGAVLAFGANFLLWIVDMLGASISISWISEAISFLSLYTRYEPFILGQLSYASCLYFFTFIVICLMGTIRVLDARRFSEGGAA